MEPPSTDSPGSADLLRRRVVYADEAPGQPGRSASRLFEDYPDRITGLLHLAPGALLPPDPERRGLEILVVDGQIEFDGILLGQHGYARRPGDPHPAITAATATTLFIKRGHILPEDTVETILEPRPALWQDAADGPAQTLSLHENLGITVALMRYRAGAAAIARRRPGGEEILVLDGTLLDERSAYPRGSWIRNPPGMMSEPFSVEGCLIYVQSGHLPLA